MNYSKRSPSAVTNWNILFQYTYIILALIQGIVLVPLYLRYIPAQTYGAWLASGNILAWLSVIDPGMSSVLQQQVGIKYGRKDNEGLSKLIFSGLAVTAIVSFGIASIGIIASFYIGSWLGIASSSERELIQLCFFIAVVGTAIHIFSFSITAINQGLLSSLGVGIINITVTVLSISITIILLQRGYGLVAIPISLLFRGIGMTACHAVYLAYRISGEKIEAKLSFEETPHLLKLIGFTFFARLSSTVVSNSDALITAKFLGADLVPSLVFTRRIPEFGKTLIERPIIATMPTIANLIGSGDLDRVQAFLSRVVLFILWSIGAFTAISICFNDDLIRLWVGEKFFTGNGINVIICIGLSLSIMINSFGNLCFSIGNIKGNSIANSMQSIVYVIFMIGGVHYFGLYGVVIAPIAALLLVSGWYFPLSLLQLLNPPKIVRQTIVVNLVKTLFSTVTLLPIFFSQVAENWFDLISKVSFLLLIYIVQLWLLSSSFRLELKQIVKYLQKFH